MKLEIIIKVKSIENLEEALALVERLTKKYLHAAKICIEVDA
ncbi:hypothetical protein [Hydrogenoanaerobacterium sp.]|nr:hypothetical protein [Hydrogenoanaerobacterium sp.]